jgi:glutamyl-tRNA(Gln) amidotransferase subunit D
LYDQPHSGYLRTQLHLRNKNRFYGVTGVTRDRIAGTGSYEGRSLKILSHTGATIGDTIKLKTTDNDQVVGILMPRYESADDDHIVLKLKSGYNIGIETTKIQSVTNLTAYTNQSIPNAKSGICNHTKDGEAAVRGTTDNKIHECGDPLPNVALISTGGTIASKIDYRTGGVHSALSASDIYASIPELGKYASIDPEVILNEYSENLKPEHWTLIANKVAEKIKSGTYRGIIISHGTDTMHYTASALSFALQDPPVPVVLVGAQRSSDRPSSDAALNLIGAAVFCIKSDYSGVFVAMHAGPSDDFIACHVGTRVRKNHTSRRDAFESIDMEPIALIKGDTIEMQLQQQPQVKLNPRNNNSSNFLVRPAYDRRILLMKYHPGFDPRLLANFTTELDYKAIVLEGTGLGHVSRECIPEIRRMIDSGILVFMTSQCIWGRTRMTVYDTGRDLLKIGVIPLSDMLPETALVKAMWVIANSKDREHSKKIMQQNIANEITSAIPLTDKGI